MATDIIMRSAEYNLVLPQSIIVVKGELIVIRLKPEFNGRFLVGSAFGFMPGI